MKPTTEILSNIMKFAKENKLKVTKLCSDIYEENEQFDFRFEREVKK